MASAPTSGSSMDLDTNSDDDVSIATTIDEAVDSDQEWLVNCVLAEAEIDGEIKYLIDWQGYPLYDASWEPQENLGEDLLQGWEEAKAQPDYKRESNRNIANWRQAVLERLHARLARHEERNLKRSRRGLKLSTTVDELFEIGISQLRAIPTGEEDASDEKPPAKTSEAAGRSSMAVSPRSRRSNKESRKNSETPQASNDQKIKKPKPEPNRTAAPSAPIKNQRPPPVVAKPIQSRLSKDTLPPKPGSPRLSKKANPIYALPPKPRSPRTSKKSDSAVAQSKPPIRKSSTLPPKPVLSSQETSNVFAGGSTRKQRQNLRDASHDPTKKPKLLRPRYVRLIEKGSRDREGILPPSKQPGELLCLDPEAAKKTSQGVTESAPDSLGSPHLKSPDSREAPMTPSGPRHDTSVEVQEEQNQENDSSKSAMQDSTEGDPKKKQKKKKKSVRWDDNTIVQEPMEMDPEDSLFLNDQLPTSEMPVFKIEYTPLASDDGKATESRGPLNQAQTTTLATALNSIRRDTNTQTLTKNAKFGPSRTISLIFDGIPRKEGRSWVSIFEEEEILAFDHTCAAKDFIAQHSSGGFQSEQLCKGSVMGQDCSESLEAVVDHLDLASLGVLWHSAEFCVLMYPSKSEDWISGDETPAKENVPPLRYLIFQPHSSFVASTLAPVTSHFRKKEQDSPPGARPKLFHQLFGFEYNRLIPAPLLNTMNHPFFLAFPSSVEQEAVFLSQWLRSCNADCQIFSSTFPSHWFKFVTLNRGVVIIHEDAIWAIRLFPGFASLLHDTKGEFSFWIFTKSLCPDRHCAWTSDPDARLGDIRLDPVFPFGAAVLLTPSFLVSQPQQAYNLVKWFWQNYFDTKGPYRRGKLIVCAGIEDWYLDVTLEKAGGRASIGGDFSEIEMRQEALHDDSFRARYKTWDLLRQLARGSAKDPEGALVCAPDALDGNDEQSLVNWFGWWTIANMDQYRKFTVVGSRATKSTRMSRYIRPPNYPELFTSNPDEAYLKLDRQGPETPLYSNVSPHSFEQRLTLIENDQAETLTNHLNHLTGKIPNQKWCPVVLYKFPISYWNGDMAYHFGDYVSAFKSYQAFFNYIKPTVGGFYNTTAALLYTVEGAWSTAAYPQDLKPSRRPWIAWIRPTNPHLRPWTGTELLIWDIVGTKKLSSNAPVYEEDLIPAQQEFIKSVKEDCELKYQGSRPLTKVWLGGYNEPQSEHKHPLDATLDHLDRFIEDLKYWLPAVEDALKSRGWKLVKAQQRSRSDSPDFSTVDSMDIDTPEENNVADLKIIFHPPRAFGNDKLSKSCQNRLYEQTKAASRRRSDGKMEYTFLPTLDWYGEQMADGRGFDHIKVTTWEMFFKEYKIPDPKETGSGESK